LRATLLVFVKLNNLLEGITRRELDMRCHGEGALMKVLEHEDDLTRIKEELRGGGVTSWPHDARLELFHSRLKFNLLSEVNPSNI